MSPLCVCVCAFVCLYVSFPVILRAAVFMLLITLWYICMHMCMFAAFPIDPFGLRNALHSNWISIKWAHCGFCCIWLDIWIQSECVLPPPVIISFFTTNSHYLSAAVKRIDSMNGPYRQDLVYRKELRWDRNVVAGRILFDNKYSRP